MSRQNFFIQTLVFDIGFFSKDKATELQNRVSSLFSRSLSGVIQDVCDRTIPAHTLIKADSLVLDIGTVGYGDFENGFSSRTEAALLDYFSRFLLYAGQEPGRTEEVSFVPLAEHHLSLFENFLLTGRLPHQAAQGGVKELENTILELMSTEPAKAYAMVRSAGKSEWVRRRLAFQFSETFIEQVVHLLEPDEAPFIISYKHNIDKVHRQTPLVTSGADQFHKEVWLFILTFLIAESGSRFSRLELVSSTLKKIANRFHIAYHLLLHLLKQGIPRSGNDYRQPELIRLIDILSQEKADPTPDPDTPENRIVTMPFSTDGNQPRPPEADGKTKARKENRITKKSLPLPGGKELDWLVYYFENGSLPLRFALSGRPELAETLLSLFQSQPGEIRKAASRFSSVLISRRLYNLGGSRLISLFTGQSPAVQLHTDSYTSPSGGEPQTALTLQAKEDLLYHFLQTGFLPWWALQQPVSLQKLMEDVFSRSPEKAVALLQWAGQKDRCRKRLISQFSSGLITGIISYLPGGEEAVKAFDILVSVLPDDNRKHSAAFLFTGLLWDNYILHRYRSFSTVLFYVQAVKEAGRLYHLPVQPLSFPLKELLENGSPDALRNFILQWTGTESRPGVRPFTEATVREEEVIRIVLSGESIFDENTSANGTADVSSQPLIRALSNTLHYFFTCQSLPVHVVKQMGLPAGLFAKTSLLLLTRMSESETEKLLAQFYKNPVVKQWLESRFSEHEYRERRVLLLLNRLVIQKPPEVGLQKEKTNSLTDHIAGIAGHHQMHNLAEQHQSSPGSLPEIPLWQQCYSQENISPEQRNQKMIRVLSYFLIWQSLPRANVSAGEIPTDQVLKEIVFFLFVTDRAALQVVLNKTTANLPEGVIRITGLFKAEKGGTERQLTTFLQPALRTAMVDSLWDEKSRERKQKRTEEAKPPADILVRLAATGSGAAEQQAAQWLDFFLSHNKLPDELTTVYSPAGREVVLSLALYLSGKNKALLERIFQKDSHHPAARMRIHEWIQKKEGSRAKELAKLTEAVLQKDVVAYLRQSTARLPEAANSLQAIWDSNLPAKEKVEILAAVAKYGEAREEWVKAVSAQELYQALKKNFPSAPKPYSYLVDTITNLLNPVLQAGYERESLALHSKVFLLMILAGRITIDSPADFISRFFLYLDMRKPSFTSRLYQKLQQNWQHRKPLPGEDALITKELQKAVAARMPLLPAPAKKKEARPTSVKKESGPGQVAKTAKETNLPEIVRERKKQLPVIEPGTKLYVNNAGLVIMHPFIPTYFRLTGLTEEGNFINEEAKQRAVLLLQYMAYGTTEFEEHVLVLNKLLCGLPLEEPVPSIIQPTEKEMQVTEELFTIVFQRWTRMKNATMQGFRHAFLQREGSLIKGEAKWAMRVEPRGYDAILPTMPWAFGSVKLPWMALPVETEWV